MSWIGRRTDGSGTSSGVRSVVSSGGGGDDGAAAAGGVVVVVVVVVGSAARGPGVAGASGRRARQRPVGEVRVGGRGGGDDQQRDDARRPRAPPTTIGRSAPRRACELGARAGRVHDLLRTVGSGMGGVARRTGRSATAVLRRAVC